MVDEISNSQLKTTLGLAISVIATEHFMSAGLSSPWSVAKFAQTEEDKKEVWHYFKEASLASVLFGGILSYNLKSWWPTIGSGLTVAYYHSLYESALQKAKIQGEMPGELNLPGPITTINPNTINPLSDEGRKRIEMTFGFV